jgi:type I restriction enzyme, S subunit
MKKNWKSKSIEQCFKVKSGDFLPAKIMVKDGEIDVYGGNGISGRHNQYNLTGENIIIGRVGAKCGNVNRVEGAIWVIDNAFYISELTEEFDLHFLEHLLRKENLRDKANQTAQPVISYTTIKNVVLIIPPLSEQKRIVSIVDEAFESIDIAIENTKNNLTNARELFESYLNDIFTRKGNDWEEKKLEEVCEVRDGMHDSPKYIADGIPFITQKNIRENGLTFDNTKFISNNDHKKFHARSNVAFGDILISMIGANRGMACVVDDKRIFSIKNVGSHIPLLFAKKNN